MGFYRKTEILSYNLSNELARLGVKLEYDKDICIYSYGDYSLKIPFGQVKLDTMYAKLYDSNKKQYKELQDKWKKYKSSIFV